ncbi:MAG: hypothetical protein O2840_03265 [bacterium]|nr:hypothetical protein [bacterium]
MKKQRTKEEKTRAVLRSTLSLESVVSVRATSETKSAILQDIPLIKQDLRKTLLISFILLFVLIGIFLYLR